MNIYDNMNRYIAYYQYDISPEDVELTDEEINEINEIFDTDEHFSPGNGKKYHKKWIIGWWWKIKDSQTCYVEILSTEELSQEELDVMTQETERQISDWYNKNPFKFNLSSGKTFYIMFHELAYQDFKEE